MLNLLRINAKRRKKEKSDFKKFGVFIIVIKHNISFVALKSCCRSIVIQKCECKNVMQKCEKCETQQNMLRMN